MVLGRRQIAALLVAFSAVSLVGCGPSITTVPVRSVEIGHGDDGGMMKQLSVIHPKTIALLLEVLRSGAEVPKCKCQGRVFLLFALEDGRSVEVQILPGHTPETVDFRTEDGQYVVKRVKLAAVLEPLGVKLP